MAAEEIYFVNITNVGHINMPIDEFAHCGKYFDYEGSVGLIS